MIVTAAFAAIILGAPPAVSAETLRVGAECAYAPYLGRQVYGL